MSLKKKAYKETKIDGMYVIDVDPADFEFKGSTEREMLFNAIQDFIKSARKLKEHFDLELKHASTPQGGS
ncbi:hypothetical protein [Terrimonas ferruginea]|uniref:hypothetical protein n=1 Tax=Terrimonas ferruginea TaxID=249 RepID=UPI0003FFF906|nr:hypothetical protein [Terrimonas ferruginea]